MSNDMLNKAISIAVEAHRSQIDKVGKPYILHLIRVMEKGKTEIEKICGILHDLVEDTPWTFEQLKNEGFSNEVIEVLKCVTKQEGETYDNFINRISKNKIAIQVKLNDLEDNLDVKRFTTVNPKQLERINKYLNAYHLLKNTPMR